MRRGPRAEHTRMSLQQRRDRHGVVDASDPDRQKPLGAPRARPGTSDVVRIGAVTHTRTNNHNGTLAEKRLWKSGTGVDLGMLRLKSRAPFHPAPWVVLGAQKLVKAHLHDAPALVKNGGRVTRAVDRGMTQCDFRQVVDQLGHVGELGAAVHTTMDGPPETERRRWLSCPSVDTAVIRRGSVVALVRHLSAKVLLRESTVVCRHIVNLHRSLPAVRAPSAKRSPRCAIGDLNNRLQRTSLVTVFCVFFKVFWCDLHPIPNEMQRIAKTDK